MHRPSEPDPPEKLMSGPDQNAHVKGAATGKDVVLLPPTKTRACKCSGLYKIEWHTVFSRQCCLQMRAIQMHMNEAQWISILRVKAGGKVTYHLLTTYQSPSEK